MPESIAQSDLMAPTAAIARFAANFDGATLPDAARKAIRLAILDTLAAGRYGMPEPWTRMVRETVSALPPAAGSPGLASAWGDATAMLRPGDAALLNGVSAHAFELDDFHAKLHPGAVVLPAALAVAEATGASLEDLETATALGYETMIRVSLALDPNKARLRGWHLTGVVGPLGAAIAVAKLMNLTAEQTTWALGLAATQGAGLFAFNADGAMSKRLHPGKAAQSGVLAAELAAKGFTGPSTVLEVEDGGFLRAHSDHWSIEPLVEALGQHWHLETTNFKPYACCGSVHAYVDAAKQIRSQIGGAPKADQIVRAGVAKVVDVQCGYDYKPGATLNSQMSLRYCLAVALLDGEALPAQFRDDRIADPAVTDLARRIELVPDTELDGLYPTHYSGWAEVDGERAFIKDPAGAVTNPNREAALRGKAHALFADIQHADAARALEAVVDAGAGKASGLLGAMAG
ncbi:MAG: MmgE/PrpD family protein [Alphaproteobacteria bacterium]